MGKYSGGIYVEGANYCVIQLLTRLVTHVRCVYIYNTGIRASLNEH